MVRENPSIPWCSNCGAMMLVMAKIDNYNPWFECYECGEKISYEEGLNRVKKQKHNKNKR